MKVDDSTMFSLLSETAEKTGQTLKRTDSKAIAAVQFCLQWNSAVARHTDCIVFRKLNFWRDILPSDLEADLLDKEIGYRTQHAYKPGELLTNYNSSDYRVAAPKIFNGNYRKCYVAPRKGRFYPRGFIAGYEGIYTGDIRPFRIVELDSKQLKIDLNHPLAGRELLLSAQILDVWESVEEHGGACQDVAEMSTLNGPGMQTRFADLPTDFWSDLPFVRTDPSPDPIFYESPRMVQHLDAVALQQIEALYGRLLPKKARILDLMASWSSHLPEHLQAEKIVGLGMNESELAANEQLDDHLVQDLNNQQRLPYENDQFDAVICTASVEYLTKPLAVFAEVRRILKPRGRFILTFSNRWFPTKAIKVWQDIHEFERMGLVLEYFIQDGGFTELETWSLRGLERPADDKYAKQTRESDPVYAVWGVKE